MDTQLPVGIVNPNYIPTQNALNAIAAFKAAPPDDAPPALKTGMVMPGPSAPAIPAPIMPSVSLAAPAPQPTALQTLQAKLASDQKLGDGISQIHTPLLHGIARAGDVGLNILGSVFRPLGALAEAVPGTSNHHNLLVSNLQQQIGEQQAQNEQDQLVQDQKAQAQQRQSLSNKLDAQADADTPFTLSADQASTLGMPQLAGTSMSQRDFARLAGTHDTNATKVTTTGMRDDTSTANNQNTNQTKLTTTGMANDSRESISDAANKTRILTQQLRDATSASNNANTNDHKSTGSQAGGADGQSFKVPADVTKRAALASNVTENADAVDSVINQRPDIIGAAGGRYTSVQQMIGSDDPAIAELGVRMHNIALASNGAHGVRAAGAIEQTENELFNHFKSGPTAIHGALSATRDSMQTFLNDENNFSTTGKRTGGKGGAPTTPAPNAAPPTTYGMTATGQGGHQIGSNDGGKTWVDVKTGKALQ